MLRDYHNICILSMSLYINILVEVVDEGGENSLSIY